MIKQVIAVMALVALAGMPAAQAQDSKAAQPKGATKGAPRLRPRPRPPAARTSIPRPTSTSCSRSA